MKICVRNSDNIVKFASEDLYYCDDNYLMIGCTHCRPLNPNNSTIYEDVTLPDDFIAGFYTYDGSTFTATDALVTRLAEIEEQENEEQQKAKQQNILSEITALENQITSRRLREVMLTGDNSFIEDIEKQIATLREQLA